MSIPSSTYNIDIQLGQVTQFLANDNKKNSQLYNWGTLKGQSDLPELIQMFQENISWAKAYYSTTTGFTNMVNYMYSLVGQYYSKALSIVQAANGTTIINPSTGAPSTISVGRYQFIIGVAGSPLTAGQTVYTIVDTNIIVGSLTVSIDGFMIPIGTFSDRIAMSSVSYSSNTLVITFNQGVQNGQLYIVSYNKYVTI